MESCATNVLVIEDSNSDQLLLEECLSSCTQTQYELAFASTLKEARKHMKDSSFDVILTDIHLPDGTGLDFVREMKTHISAPFVVLSGSKDIDTENEILASGAADFIPKSDLNESLLKRVLKFSIERNKTHALLKEQTIRDQLTGLYNRLGMQSLLSQAIADAERTQKPFALFLIDVDKFKTINDTYGHSAGDRILKIVADTLINSTRCSRQTDFAIRVGGDEFALIATELDHMDNVHFIIDRIKQNLAGTFLIDGYQISVSLSIGIALYPEDGIASEELINNADFSLYRAKKKTGIAFEFFDKAKHQKIKKRKIIENSLSQAIEEGQFRLAYQPLIDTRSNDLAGCEALLRWEHPEKGLLMPHEFLQITEETGHILEIGEWVLRTACEQCVEWHKQSLKPFSVSVNIALRQLLHVSFPQTVARILEETGLEPQYLDLEISEAILIENLSQSVQVLRSLRKLGVSISLDDFGAGYSSLSRLRSLPLDRLKLDRSLIRKVGKNRFDTVIAKTVLSLARNLKITAVAEGVETAEQYRFFRNSACREVQGYYFSTPLQACEFSKKYIENIAA